MAFLASKARNLFSRRRRNHADFEGARWNRSFGRNGSIVSAEDGGEEV
jgi:hypothetical protein